MPPKTGKSNSLPTLPAPPSIDASLTPKIPFPEFSHQALNAFTLQTLEKKQSADTGATNGKSAKKPPAKKGKSDPATDLDWEELAHQNDRLIPKDFVGDFLRRHSHEEHNQDASTYPTPGQQEENGEEEEATAPAENTEDAIAEDGDAAEESPQATPSITEWRAMNRMAVVLRDTVPHPFSDAFHSQTSDPVSSTEELDIDEDLLKDFIDNQIDHLDQYSKSSVGFKLNATKSPKNASQTLSPQQDDTETTAMMKPFLSALYYIIHNQQRFNASLGFGNYLWELVYPKKDPNSQLPTENDIYVVKLWYKSAWRMIVVDSQMPYNVDTRQMQFPQTKNFEYWPAILLKALMVLAGTEAEDDADRKQLIFTDPLWCLQALSGPYLPRTLGTSNSLQCLREIRTALQVSNAASQKSSQLLSTYSKRKYLALKKHEATAESDQIDKLPPTSLHVQEEDASLVPTKDCLLCATCVAPNELNEDEDDSYFFDMGLDPSIVYHVSELKYVRGKAVLHLFGMNQTDDWKGELSYSDAQTWDAAFEDELGFHRQDRLMPNSNPQQLPVTDFWIPFEQFQQYFTTIHVLQNVGSLKNHGSLFGPNLREKFCLSVDRNSVKELNFSVCFLKDEEKEVAIVEDPKAKKGGKKGSPPTNQQDSDQPDDETDTVGPYDMVQIEVQAYDWKAGRIPSQKLVQTSTYQMYDNLVRVALPSAISPSTNERQMFMVTVQGYSKKRTLLECLSHVEHPSDQDETTSTETPVAVGTIDDILLQQAGVKHLIFEAQDHPAHQPNEWKVWFMQNITISSDVWFGANLQLLPSDETPPSETEPAEEEKSTDTPPEQEQNGEDSTVSPIPDVSSLLPHVNFLLIDNNERKTYHSSIGCCLYPLKLTVPENVEADSKSKKGAGPTGSYTLMAMAKAPQDHLIPEGKYSLEVFHEEAGLESIQPVDSLFTTEVSGCYIPNQSRELFNHVLWAGENSFVSLHLEVNRNVPITLSVENESGESIITANIDERNSRALHLSIPPIAIEPSQKNQEKCLVLRAFVHEAYARRMLHEYQKELLSHSFATQVHNTPVEEPPAEEPADDKKNGKKGGKAAPKSKAKGGKGKSTEQGRQVKIPSKQTEPQIMSSVPDINPPSAAQEAEDTNSVQQEPITDQQSEYVHYTLNCTFTSPNIIIEEFNTRAEKVSKLMEEWEEKEAGRLENGVQLRDSFFKQRAREYDAQGRKDHHIVGNSKWNRASEQQSKWLAQARWRPETPTTADATTAMEVEVHSQEQYIENLEERITQHEEQIKATLEALHQECRADPTKWSYSLKELDEQLQEQHKSILSTFEEAHRVRADFLSNILQDVEEKLADLEKRKAEHAKNAKKKGKK